MKRIILFFSMCLLFVSVVAQDITGVTAVSVVDFLNSLGAVSSVSRRVETVEGSIECIRYTGLRWLRGGFEDNAPVEDFIRLYKETGTQMGYGFLSGKSDLDRLLNDARQLAEANALLAMEGLNEPNNWGITYQGEQGGGKSDSWMAVARLQRDLYSAVKSDPVLKNYLETLPHVTTETGFAISGKDGVTEEIQARLYLNLYLSQFKQGWKHTAIYLLDINYV